MSNDKLTIGNDIREVVEFAAYLGRLDEMSQEEAYEEVYGEDASEGNA